MRRFRRRRRSNPSIKTNKLSTAAKIMIGFAAGEAIIVNYPGTTTEIVLLILAFGPVPVPKGLGSVVMGMALSTSYSKMLYDTVYQSISNALPRRTEAS